MLNFVLLELLVCGFDAVYVLLSCCFTPFRFVWIIVVILISLTLSCFAVLLIRFYCCILCVLCFPCVGMNFISWLVDLLLFLVLLCEFRWNAYLLGCYLIVGLGCFDLFVFVYLELDYLVVCLSCDCVC